VSRVSEAREPTRERRSINRNGTSVIVGEKITLDGQNSYIPG